MAKDSGIDRNTPALTALQAALDQGDVPEVRRQLTRLNEDERATLRMELGDAQFDVVYRTVRRARRGSPKGHVIVLHGIMGGTLAVRRKNDTDGVWVNFFRLLTGRMADLELNAEGGPVNPGLEVIVTGQLKKYYLPMVLRLDQQWAVKPFAYDWREDISKSAQRLADTIRTFGGGRPVHLVAHSMGGLVSRYMIHKNPDLWASMADGDDLVRGGRLVMLGTPNHGSYAIPLALTGEEKQVKLLAKVDLKHGIKRIKEITGTFPGSYEMLPSPLLDLGDDHRKLYEQKHWGTHPVHAPLLERAARFHDEIEAVVHPERFIYVAGYNRDTPHRIRVDGPGSFSYRMTRDGDGRVPHDLGLLDGVPTYWVDATHGDLAREPDVLDAVDELLERGHTGVLSSVKPVTRARADEGWQDPAEFELIDADIDPILQAETRSLRSRTSKLSDEQQARVESELLEDYLGGLRATGQKRWQRKSGRRDREAPQIEVEVIWGDVTKCDADIYTVGHYQGVLPQAAEMALDAAMSNDPHRRNLDRHVLRQHTLRGSLRGALGDVNFYPWITEDGRTRTVAVAGMGRIGSFTPAAVRTMSAKLAWAVSGLPGIDTVCTVLIGSGEGALTVDEALSGLVLGMSDALRGDLPDAASGIRKVRIVEIYRDRAQHIQQYLLDNRERFKEYLEIDMPDDIVRGDNAWISSEDALSLMLSAVMDSAKSKEGGRRRKQYDDLLGDAARGKVPKQELREAMRYAVNREQKSGRRAGATVNRPMYYVTRQPAAGNERIPFRLSYLTEGGDIRAAAISDTATVSERVLRFDHALVDEVCAEVMDVDAPLRDATPGFLRQLVLPQEFRELIDRGEAFVFEVDRAMAQIPWEILATGKDPRDKKPLAIRARVARQLRTTYSGGLGMGDRKTGSIRALVVGDPGDPKEGDNLPGAQREAFAMYKLLRSRNVEAELLVGAPGTSRTGRLRAFPAATRVRVLEKLMLERYDILHYCGHGDFDPFDTDRAGWLFADGLLTAYELERVSEVPGMVVANACLSGRTSRRAAGDREINRARDEAALLPSLADEFFRRGVINYIGTAWEVSDEGAVLFADKLYRTLIPGTSAEGEGGRSGSQTATVGDAVLEARKLLWKKQDVYGKLWAAYQHYGDPTSPMSFTAEATRSRRTNRSSGLG